MTSNQHSWEKEFLAKESELIIVTAEGFNDDLTLNAHVNTDKLVEYIRNLISRIEQEAIERTREEGKARAFDDGYIEGRKVGYQAALEEAIEIVKKTEPIPIGGGAATYDLHKIISDLSAIKNKV